MWLIFTSTVTPQLFLQAPTQDDQLPASPDVGISDIRITTFASSVIRSNAPTYVLTLHEIDRQCVSAVVNNVKQFKPRPQGGQSDVVDHASKSLWERGEATLSNLVTTSKTQATSYSMSSVGLLNEVVYQPLLRRRSTPSARSNSA